MKNFFKTIGKSFYSSDFYKQAKDQEVSKSIKFVLKVALFLGIVLGIIAFILFFIFSGTLKKSAINFVEKSYPDTLIVTIKDGNLTANNTEPVVIPIPFEKKANTPNNLTVLVPNEKAEPSVLEKYNTLSAITSNGIISMKNSPNSGQFSIYNYQKANRIITKGSAIDSSYFLLHIIKIAVACMIIPSMILMFFVICLSHMIFLFFVALLIYLIMKIRKLNITYKQSYKMGLIALIPLVILETVLFPFHLTGSLFTIIVVILVILYTTKTWGKETPVETAENLAQES